MRSGMLRYARYQAGDFLLQKASVPAILALFIGGLTVYLASHRSVPIDWSAPLGADNARAVLKQALDLFVPLAAFLAVNGKGPRASTRALEQEHRREMERSERALRRHRASAASLRGRATGGAVVAGVAGAGGVIDAATAGALLGRASPHQYQALHNYAHDLGLAFQIADDILDVESDAATLGKAAGKDAGAGKGTLVSLYGLAKSKERLTSLVADAEKSLAPFGAKASVLIEAARFIAERKS